MAKTKKKVKIKLKEVSYRWRDYTPGKADAAKVVEEIDEVIGKHGSATPELIVDRAIDADSELHKCFEWDNNEAAKKYRLHQARNVLCSVVFIEKDEDGKESEPIRVYFNVNQPESHKAGEFKKYTVVFSNPNYRDETEYKVYKRLKELCENYNSLVRFEKVWTAIQSLPKSDFEQKSVV